MTTTRNFKARVNKCITGAFCSSLKDQWALKNCTLVLDCSNVHTEIRLFFYYYYFKFSNMGHVPA